MGGNNDRSVLIAGVGNIFFGDDGFGVEVVGRLRGRELPSAVVLGDYGISGMHLAYDLLAGYDTTILVDATPRGDEPGTVYVIEPELAGEPLPAQSIDAHGMHPDSVFGLLEVLGGSAGHVLIVGCEPEQTEHGIGLSAPVEAAVETAADRVIELAEASIATTLSETTEV